MFSTLTPWALTDDAVNCQTTDNKVWQRSPVATSLGTKYSLYFIATKTSEKFHKKGDDMKEKGTHARRATLCKGFSTCLRHLTKLGLTLAKISDARRNSA